MVTNEQANQRGAAASYAASGAPAFDYVRFPLALAVDTMGNLYIAGSRGRIQKRDDQGTWSVIVTASRGPGQVVSPSGLVVDAAGNLYVADTGNHRVQKYTQSHRQ